MNDKARVIRHALMCVLCLGCGILLCAAQTSLLPHYLSDAHLAPDLLLCLTLCLGVLAGPLYGSLFGIYAGVLADATGGFGIFLLPVFYMLCGYGAHVCKELLPKQKFPVYAAFGALAALGRAVIAVGYVMLSSGNVELLQVARYVCLPYVLGTLLALPILYPLSLLLTLPIKNINHH